MEYKNAMAEIKSIDDKGEGILRFIKFNQEDKDSDITLPGFIGRQKAILLPAHNWRSDHPPLGTGESFEADGATNFRFRLNLSVPLAQEWYNHLKFDRAHDSLQQVSYGFQPYADGQERTQKDGRMVRILKPRPDGSPGAKLREVSFVVLGSGNDTAVLDVKSTDALLSTPQPDTKESRGVDTPETPSPASSDAKSAPAAPEPVEDWQDYPEDRRPPLPVLTKWLRLYRYHMPFLRDIRKRDGKDISPETIAEFSDVVQEAVAVATGLNIKVMTAPLLPNLDEEALLKQRYDARLQELSAHVNAQTAQQVLHLQSEAAALAEKARVRAARMRELFGV